MFLGQQTIFYFYEEIRKELYNNYGKNKLYSEGLIIKTSIDSEIQKLAENSLIEGLLSYQKKQNLIRVLLLIVLFQILN